jgi:L-asparaginase II
MTNPVLIEVTRGPLIECVHRGTLAVVTRHGEVVVGLGDIDRAVYPRSAIKILQAMPLVETGAADAFGFQDRHLALAAASHTGTEHHIKIARDMLARAGIDEFSLACGVHPPLDEAAARALWATGQRPGPLHHNCSGKHAGMLAVARHMREDIDDYWDPGHPVQRRVQDVIEDVSGTPLTADVCGIDGCSVPNWAMPVKALAMAYARLTAAEGLNSRRHAAAARIIDAAWAEPELAAGIGRLDTLVLSSYKGEAYIKTGAEGAYAGVFPRLGLGFAMKIEDGASRASDAVARFIVEAYVPAARGTLAPRTLKNAQGKDVGFLRPSPLLALALG